MRLKNHQLLSGRPLNAAGVDGSAAELSDWAEFDSNERALGGHHRSSAETEFFRMSERSEATISDNYEYERVLDPTSR